MSYMEIVSRTLSYTKRAWPLYIFAGISAAIQVALSLYCPILIGQAVDKIVAPGRVDFQGMVPILLAFLGVLLLAAVFGFLTGMTTNRIAYSAVKELRLHAHKKLFTLPFSFLDNHSPGETLSRVIGDIDTLSDGLLQGFSQLITGVLTIAGTLLFMLSINVYVALAVVVITPLSLITATFIAKRTHSTFGEQARHRGEIGALVQELVGSARLVRTFGYQETAEKRFSDCNQTLYQSGVRSQFYSSITNPCTRFVNGVVYAVAGILGAVLALRGVISVGQLSSFLSYANQYTKPFNEISGVIAELQSAVSSARRVFQLLDLQGEDPTQGIDSAKGSGRVEFSQLSFSYHEDRTLIEDLSLSVKAGEHVAIVGPTGCGKTTLINLLMRFYRPTGGKIIVDGTDIAPLSAHALRARFGMVLQDSWLFSGTVSENIAYARPDAEAAEIVAAAKSAYAHSFIMKLPEGYDTMISQGGENLSAGQRQLLCIARVMLSPPPILILDEATSSIDTLTEQRVQKAFLKLIEGRTSFIVAHRLSTIQGADLILVMDRGNVVEQGTHQSLLLQNGLYKKLYESQFSK